MSETDEQFVERIGLDFDLSNTADIQRLFALARRGAEAAARIEQLEAALRSVFQPGGWTHATDCQCSVCQKARAALGEERT